MEEELNYSTVVFKSKGQPPPSEANDDSTVYSSVKRETTTSAAGEAASRSPHFRLLVVCSGTLCIITLLSVIAIIYITVAMKEGRANFEAELGNLTAANQQLILERSFLQQDIDNLNWTMRVILKFNNFPVDAYCPNKTCRPCRSGWIQFQEKCYLFYQGTPPWKTWIDSRKFCQSQTADLVVIDNLEEQKFISANIKYYYDDYHGYWTGLSQTADKTWRWVDGRNVTLQYWVKGFADACALIIPVYNYTANWKPSDCAMQNQFICESQVLIKSN